jgi:hypothetical protein
MNKGLSGGFVRYGTIAHFVLLTIHADGKRSLVSLRDDLVEDRDDTHQLSAALSAALAKLVKYGFLYVTGWHRGGSGQTCAVYSLVPPSKPVKRLTPLSVRDRSRASRSARKNLTASVFEFRGRIDFNKEI